jgi:phage gpG-like protein
MNNGNLDTARLISGFRTIYHRLPKVAGAMAVAHFKMNFRKQGWTDRGRTTPWPPRKNRGRGDSRRAILIKSGRLRRSIQITRSGPGYVGIGTYVPYAQIHNDGGHTTSVAKVPQTTIRAHRRRTDRGVQTVKEHQRSPHTRKMNSRIPQRKFLGRSHTVENEAKRWVIAEIDKLIKQV